MLYSVLKRSIMRENYKSKDDMAEKLGILYANDQLTTIEYEELIQLLNKEMGDE